MAPKRATATTSASKAKSAAATAPATSKKTAATAASSSSKTNNNRLPATILVDGREVSMKDLEGNALFDYVRADPENHASAKRCAVWPDCAKGRDCTFAHFKAGPLAQFLNTSGVSAPAAAASGNGKKQGGRGGRGGAKEYGTGSAHAIVASSTPNPYEDKNHLLAYAGIPDVVGVDGVNHSIHELEPNNLFNYLRQHPDRAGGKGCANFPNCPKGKDCSFAHLKSARMAADTGAANDDQSRDTEAERALRAYDGLPSHVLVDGHHMSIHDLEPNNLFNYFLQHPTSPTAKRCQCYPFCPRGKDCSFGHLKSIKIKALVAAKEREGKSPKVAVNNSNAAFKESKVDEREYRGLPKTILVDAVVVSIYDLEPSQLFDYLRETPDGQAARRCSFFPQCPRGRNCGFAHVRYAREDPVTTFAANAKPSAADYNGLPEFIVLEGRKMSSTDLEPTLLFDYIRLHPEAENIKKCRNFPYCRSGRSCGYAHLKADRAAAISGMPAYLTIEGEQVDVLKQLYPTAMFAYARNHPESSTIRWCKHWPKCEDGDACTYAHKKER